MLAVAVADAEDRAGAHRGAEPSDHLTFEEDDPVTRYAPIVQLGGGLAAGTQKLTAAETIEVLISRAQGALILGTGHRQKRRRAAGRPRPTAPFTVSSSHTRPPKKGRAPCPLRPRRIR